MTRSTLLLTAFLTAFVAASSSPVFAASPAETQTEAAATTDSSTSQTPPTPEQSGAASEPEVGGEGLPLLPPQSLANGGSSSVLPLLPKPAAPGVARGVAVEELPLLVTEPPIDEGGGVEIPLPVTGGSDSLLNPFSPLLLPQPPQQAAEPAAPVAAPQPATPPAVAAPSVQEAAPAAAAPAPISPAVSVPLPQARVGRPALPQSLAANLRTTVPPTADLSAGPLDRALVLQPQLSSIAPLPTAIMTQLCPKLMPSSPH